MVVKHHITEGKPAFCVGDTLKLQGRKGMSIETGWEEQVVINTGVLGKPDTRRLRAAIPDLNCGGWSQNEVNCVNLDEATGRIMIVVGHEHLMRGDVYAKQLYIADLPP